MLWYYNNWNICFDCGMFGLKYFVVKITQKLFSFFKLLDFLVSISYCITTGLDFSSIVIRTFSNVKIKKIKCVKFKIFNFINVIFSMFMFKKTCMLITKKMNVWSVIVNLTSSESTYSWCISKCYCKVKSPL